MTFPARVERWLLPADMERDPRFQDDLRRLSRNGLLVLGSMEIAVAMFPLRVTELLSWRFCLSVAIALATMFASPAKRVGRHVRAVALISCMLAATIPIETALWLAPRDRLLAGELSLLLFGVVAAVPLIPMQTCALGSALSIVYGVSAAFAQGWDGAMQAFVIFLTCFATGVSALLYAQRRKAFETHRREMAIQETLTAAQARAQVAETAVSVGRLAAALTHEINSPLGALRSAVDTLLGLSSRHMEAKPEANPEEAGRIAAAQADLCRSIQESARRLSSVAERLKRLMTLEPGDKQEININELLADVKLLMGDDITREVDMEWRLDGDARIAGSSNQLITVFSDLLRNAITAVNGRGRIEVTTSRRDGLVEVAVRDNGHGMDSDDAANIFDPAFAVRNGRVRSGNWSLFTARQIVNEHGGEIWIESEKGKGATAHVTLPVIREFREFSDTQED